MARSFKIGRANVGDPAFLARQRPPTIVAAAGIGNIRDGDNPAVLAMRIARIMAVAPQPLANDPGDLFNALLPNAAAERPRGRAQ
jgi:hypothetical protein